MNNQDAHLKYHTGRGFNFSSVAFVGLSPYSLVDIETLLPKGTRTVESIYRTSLLKIEPNEDASNLSEALLLSWVPSLRQELQWSEIVAVWDTRLAELLTQNTSLNVMLIQETIEDIEGVYSEHDACQQHLKSLSKGTNSKDSASSDSKGSGKTLGKV